MPPIGGVRAGYLSAGKDAIPDSQVSRADDNTLADGDGPRGLQIKTTVEWPDRMDGIISANTSGADTATIHNSDNGDLIGQANISGKSAGDVFSVDLDNPLQPETVYNFELSDPDGSYTQGQNDSPDTPVTSPDGNIEIVGGGFDNTRSTTPRCIVTVGNLA